MVHLFTKVDMQTRFVQIYTKITKFRFFWIVVKSQLIPIDQVSGNKLNNVHQNNQESVYLTTMCFTRNNFFLCKDKMTIFAASPRLLVCMHMSRLTGMHAYVSLVCSLVCLARWYACMEATV